MPVLHHGSFESPRQRAWSWRGRTLVTPLPDAPAGQHVVRLDSPNAAVEQVLFGLKPGTTYKLTASAKASGNGASAVLGVKEHGNAEVSVSTQSAAFEKLSVEFTTGPDASTARIYCYMPAGTGSTWFDDVQIAVATPG
jgi:hypothetical protein